MWTIITINVTAYYTVDPISQLFWEHGTAGELRHPQKTGGVVLPADQYALILLEPGEEPFDEPAAWIAAEVASILGLEFACGPKNGPPKKSSARVKHSLETGSTSLTECSPSGLSRAVVREQAESSEM